MSLSGLLAGFGSQFVSRRGAGRAVSVASVVSVVSVVTLAGLVAGLVAVSTPAAAKPAAPGLATVSLTVSLTALPPEAQATERLIRAGGPFPYPKDGGVFGNRERQLPAQRRGFYREYTVSTPGAKNRAAKRIVCGGYQVTTPQTCYYTDDHYATFRRIVQ